MNQPSTIKRTDAPVPAGRSVRDMPALARECVGGALTALPALTELAVSIGRCATGDTGDFHWLAPTVRSWLARLPWACEVPASDAHAAPLPPTSRPIRPATAGDVPEQSADAG